MKLAKFIKEKSIDVNSLPNSIKKKISTYNETLAEYKEIAEAYEEEEDDELGNELQELEEELSALETQTIKEILKFQSDKAQKEASKKPVETPTPPASNPKRDEFNASGEEKEEKSSAIGWLVGGILLVASLGAYNYFKDKKQ